MFTNKIFVEDDRLGTDVHSEGSGVNIAGSSINTRRPTVGLVPSLVRHRGEQIHRCRSAAAVTASSLAGERISRGRLAFVSVVGVNIACLIETLLQ